eukprot:m.196387 g.196387  ORF g.196387 m.196387 type:complete len:879 (+) comp32620_c0_seq3:187-2823(+)
MWSTATWFSNPLFDTASDVPEDSIGYAMSLTQRLINDDNDGLEQNFARMGKQATQELSSLPIRHAAFFLHEGRLNLHLDEHPSTKLQLQLWNFLHLSYFRYFDLTMSILYLLLATVENPRMPEFNNVLGLEIGIIIVQICCLSTILFQILVKMKITSTFATGKFPKGTKFQLAVGILLLFDLIVYILQVYAIDDHNHEMIENLDFMHVLRALRPLYLLSTDLASEIRRVMRQIVYVTYEVTEMIGFLFFYTGVCAVAATFIFIRDKDTNFSNLGESFTQLFVLITTCNYPDVMLPEYTRSKWFFFLFFFFIIFGIYFILNLLLAIVYRLYTEEERNKFKKRFLRQRDGIRYAYYALTRGELDGIPWAVFRHCVREYDHRISDKRIALIFKMLNKSKSGTLSLEEFYDFFEVIQLDWQAASDGGRSRTISIGSWRSHDRFSTYRIRWLYKIMRSQRIDVVHCMVVLTQSIYLTYTSSQLTPSNEEEKTRALLEVVVGFLLYFSVESVIKISTLTFKTFWLYTWHRVDMFFNLVSWIIVFAALGTGAEGRSLLGPFTILRAFRLCSLLTLSRKNRNKSHFKALSNTAVLIVPNMIRFAGALFGVTYYSFAIIGMTFLHNTASKCPSAINDTLIYECGLPYATVTESVSGQTLNFGHYQEMNFDDIRNAYVTLFTLMVINDWNNTMGGHTAMKGPWSRAFFMLNYVFTVLIVVNVILAYVLEMFQVVVVGQQVSSKERESEAAPLRGNDLSMMTENVGMAGIDAQQERDDSVVADTNFFPKKKVKLSRQELMENCSAEDPDVKRMADPNSEEAMQGYALYHGKTKVTQDALYRLLYKDDLVTWIRLEGDHGGTTNHARNQVARLIDHSSASNTNTNKTAPK